jgi:predicted DNA-binding transcriptional regulator AlpA
MSKRLITLRQIQAEKLPRSRSWIFAELKAGKFPRPLDTNGCGPNLWEEYAIDTYVANFVAEANQRAQNRDAAAARSARAHGMVDARRSRRSPSAPAQAA